MNEELRLELGPDYLCVKSAERVLLMATGDEYMLARLLEQWLIHHLREIKGKKG